MQQRQPNLALNACPSLERAMPAPHSQWHSVVRLGRTATAAVWCKAGCLAQVDVQCALSLADAPREPRELAEQVVLVLDVHHLGQMECRRT